MNARAGSLIFATSFASSLLGSNALADGIAGWDMASNWRIIQRLRIALQISLILLIFEIVAWLLAIAQSHHLRG